MAYPKSLFLKKGPTRIKKLFKKSYVYASLFGLLLTASFSYSMLKTFVLSESITTVKVPLLQVVAPVQRQPMLARLILAIVMTISPLH